MITKDRLQFITSYTKGALLGIDVGLKRTGLAVTASDLSIASSHSTIDTSLLIKKSSEIIKEYNIKGVIIGWPLELDSSESENCKYVMSVAEKVFKNTNLPILLFDERFTSKIAQKSMIEQNISRKKRDFLDNAAAAQIILSDFINIIKSDSKTY